MMRFDTGDQELDSALGEVNRVFARTPGSSDWSGWWDDTDSSVTLAQSAWELSEQQYRDYCHTALVHCKGKEKIEALRYFLPRLLRDVVAESIDAPRDHFQIASDLFIHRWQEWPECEVNAIRRWIDAWFDFAAQRTTWPGSRDVTSFIIDCGIDMNAWFHDFRERDRPRCVAWLAENIEDNWEELLKTGSASFLGGDCLGRSPEAGPILAIKLVILLLRDSSRALLEEAFFAATDDEAQALYSSALQHAQHCVEYGDTHPASPLAAAIQSDGMRK